MTLPVLHQSAAFLVVCSLVSSLAVAAQVPMKMAPMKDEPLQLPAAYSWTGFYAGLNIGFVSHDMSVTDNQAATFNATIEQNSNPEVSGGFQIGYRHQCNPLSHTNVSGVYGIELSANFSDSDFHQVYGSPYALYELEAKNSLKDSVLLQAIGGLATDRTFLFLAAGAAWTNISGNFVNTDGVPFFNGFSLGKRDISPALGAGIEYAFNSKLSARFKADMVLTNSFTTYDNSANPYNVSNDVVQAVFAVNYRFG